MSNVTTEKQIKLNLGCAGYKKEGYVNVDWAADFEPDVLHDLNKTPYPFADSSVDLIESSHSLEHLDRPFELMKEMHRILKPGGKLHLKVPHFSRGMAHAEHVHGFDVTYPLYFNEKFAKAGFFVASFELQKMSLHWLAFLHLMPFMGFKPYTIKALSVVNKIISFLANLSPSFCSRIWCFWVGGFEEIEFVFVCKK